MTKRLQVYFKSQDDAETARMQLYKRGISIRDEGIVTDEWEVPTLIPLTKSTSTLSGSPGSGIVGSVTGTRSGASAFPGFREIFEPRQEDRTNQQSLPYMFSLEVPQQDQAHITHMPQQSL